MEARGRVLEEGPQSITIPPAEREGVVDPPAPEERLQVTFDAAKERLGGACERTNVSLLLSE